MKFCQHLDQQLDALHLLKHPFYQAWNEGKLDIGTLQLYAKEYYHHVAAFPRYISYIHAACSDLKTRQILLENLIDEEQGEHNHPELWLRFAEGLGANKEECQRPAQLLNTQTLVDEYFRLVKADYATGLGALYAYERQTPAVSQSKIEGLKKHYGITDPRTLEFFLVHIEADEWHTQEVSDLIENLSPEDQTKAEQGALIGAQLLWAFLDGMLETIGTKLSEPCLLH